MEEIRTLEQLAKAMSDPAAVLLKHSTDCGVSYAALQELERFMDSHPDVPVFCLNVTESRELSDEVERRTGVEHESPQALVLQQGIPVWHASHFDITADAIKEALG